jgi:hypothetical protein
MSEIVHSGVSGIVSQCRAHLIIDSVWPRRCFEIATQFLAIFRSSASTSSKPSKSDDHAYQLLSMWTTRRIDTFLQDHIVAKCLPSISDTATLRDALESVTFFATSMGRVGADFSPLLQDIFQPCLVSIVTSHWSEGLNILENTLRVCRDTGIASPLYSNREIIQNENEAAGGVAKDLSAPPRQILSLPPLARVVNAFLIGLNELRRCLLPCTFPELRSYFRKEFIDKAKQILVQNERAVLTPGFLNMKGEDAGKLRSVAIELKEEFENCAEPYLSGALELALGSIDTMPERFVQKVEEEDNGQTEIDESMTPNETIEEFDAPEEIEIHDGSAVDEQPSGIPVPKTEEAKLEDYCSFRLKYVSLFFFSHFEFILSQLYFDPRISPRVGI